jgi:5'-3' exonuclease
MKNKGFMLIDGNNIGHACNNMKPLKAGDMPVQAIYGMIRSIRSTISTFGGVLNPVVLWDGISWRKEFYPDYKANRDANSGSKSDEKKIQMRKEYRLQSSAIKEGFTLLGITQMQAYNLEADDLAAILVDRYKDTDKRVLMVSGDKDWVQLISSTVTWLDPIQDVRITTKTIKEKLGVETPEAWLDVKCLMGDTGDNVPGVGGIGSTGAIDLVNTYGSVNNFITDCLTKTIDVSTIHSKFRALAEDENKQIAFGRNKQLMDLRSKRIPKPKELTVEKNKLDKEGFKLFCEKYQFGSILRDFDNWIEPFEKRGI